MISGSLVLYHNDKNQITNVLQEINFPCQIIDNSTTNKLQAVCKNFEQIDYLHVKNNLGFGKAHNLAFKTLQNQQKLGKYHLLINPDISFKNSILPNLLNHIQSDSTIGLISPKILYPDNSLQPQCRLLPSPFDMIRRRVLKGKKLKKFNKHHELHLSGYNTIFNAPFIQGSFWLVRSNLYEKLKGFDERFFLYMEDVDFCRRLHRFAKITFYPHVYVKHEWQKASSHNLKLLATHIISMIKYFNKWGWIFDNEKTNINAQAQKYIAQMTKKLEHKNSNSQTKC